MRTKPKQQARLTITRDEYDGLLADAKRLKEAAEQLSAEYKRLKEAGPKPPQPPQPLTPEQQWEQAGKRRYAALREISGLLNDISECDLRDLEIFRLIQERDSGFTTPIEQFINHLILIYGLRDRRGVGMTLEDVESSVEDLRDDMQRTIEQSHFLASRYPLPEAKKAAATEGVN